MSNRDRAKEKIAEQFFKFVHPDRQWGISGTIDDTSWRRFEHRCLRFADMTLAIPELRVVAENQEIPPIPEFQYNKEDDKLLLKRGAINYSKLLAGWVKCEPARDIPSFADCSQDCENKGHCQNTEGCSERLREKKA